MVNGRGRRRRRAAADIQNHPRRRREEALDQLLHAGELERPGPARQPPLFVVPLVVRDNIARSAGDHSSRRSQLATPADCIAPDFEAPLDDFADYR